MALALALAVDDLSTFVYVNIVETTKKSKLEYQRDEHRVHLIVYHLIWCPKRRKPVLVGAVARDCDLLIRAKCAERGWEVVALELQPDHVDLRVRVTPSDSPADVAKAVKRHTSHVLRGR